MEDNEDMRVKLNGETARIAWAELQKPFARGAVVKVGAGLDLVDVAASFARDDKTAVERWLRDGSVARLTDQDARDWQERDPTLWAVVAAPWVLVQERGH
jgi:hypothetical protein